ncbi:MAG: hypothetical protein ACLGG7_11490 [Bacteriovoracia bacterium]
MGLTDVRAQIVKYLRAGQYQHDTTRRGEIEEKNLLVTNVVSIVDVIQLILATKGHQYSSSRHHSDRTITVHIFKPLRNGVRWYIKCYVLEPNVWFISVHR